MNYWVLACCFEFLLMKHIDVATPFSDEMIDSSASS